MKIYRVGYRDDFDEHQGYDYFTTKKEALKADQKNHELHKGEIGEINVELTKRSIMKLLSQWASHPDNG